MSKASLSTVLLF